MYRDNSLMPKEAVRLATLGELARQPLRYADLAVAVRRFTSRIVGPSLDLMGTSLELLRYEGLVEAVDGSGMEDNALLRITGAGWREFTTLMRANVRAPSSDDLNKLVITLKLRFLDLLEPADQADQAEALTGLFETELARLEDLRASHADEPGLLKDWLDHDISQVRATLAWFAALPVRRG
jgi:DNA-binding PadR family transcriptional regulator